MESALGIFHNDYSSPPSVSAKRGDLLDLYCENWVVFLMVKLTKEWVPPKI